MSISDTFVIDPEAIARELARVRAELPEPEAADEEPVPSTIPEARCPACEEDEPSLAAAADETDEEFVDCPTCRSTRTVRPAVRAAWMESATRPEGEE